MTKLEKKTNSKGIILKVKNKKLKKNRQEWIGNITGQWNPKGNKPNMAKFEIPM